MSKSLARKLCVFFTSVLSIHFLFVYATSKPVAIMPDEVAAAKVTTAEGTRPSTINLYDSLALGKLGLNRQAYNFAMAGYQKLLASGKLKNAHILSIVDFSLPSSKKRLFIVDVKQAKILFNTYVSHGRNSGRETAASFSNAPESFKSSLGFYITKDTYIGKHGFSLRLDGQDKGFNDNALSRAIVMHNASYVDESLIRSQGYIGRSLGCPAIPEKLHKPIIDKIKSGSCLFIYGGDKSYAARSTILNKVA